VPPGNLIHELEVTVLNGTKGGNRVSLRGGVGKGSEGFL